MPFEVKFREFAKKELDRNNRQLELSGRREDTRARPKEGSSETVDLARLVKLKQMLFLPSALMGVQRITTCGKVHNGI